jgi:hypothetical protein
MAGSTTFSRKGKKIVMIPTPTGGLAPFNVTAPVASGTVAVGSTVSCTSGTWSSTTLVTYSYQWQRNLTDIAGAINPTYVCVNADLSTNLTCVVTAANQYGVAYKSSNQLNSISNPSPAYTYDTTIGNGVDSAGFAALPLRAGANRYYVGAGGSDANAGTSHALRKATLAAAVALVADSNGDQVLVAQGSTFSEVIPNMNGKRGFSPLYPTVIQSYDPADPLNEAKYGRASGSNRPVVNTGASGIDLGGGGGPAPTQPAGKFVIRGLDFNPGNVSSQYMSVVPSTTASNDYILYENNLFRYTEVYVDQATSPNGVGKCFIMRNNAFYGSWRNLTDHGAGSQGAYADNIAGVTFEDNVFWHNGWQIGVSRDNTAATGGLGGDEIFRHSYYIQQDCRNSIVRRNLIIDGPADGGQNRAHTLLEGNVYIDNPTTVALGGGAAYDVAKPYGVDLDFTRNIIIGDADITTSFPRGQAIVSINGRPISKARYNAVVRSRAGTSGGQASFSTGALSTANQPNYMTWDHNVVYQWSSAAAALNDTTGAYPAQNFPTYTNNVWDAATSGSNTNDAGTVFTNAYTAASLYAALTATYPSITDKTSLINYAIANPEAQVQRKIVALMQAGYNVPAATLGPVTATINPAQGTADGSILVGTTDGSTITTSGLPTGLTVDSSTRSWAYDGTSPAASGTFTLTETLNGVSNNSTISYNIANPPVLSSAVGTAINSTQATVGATTDTGSGTLYFVVTTSVTKPTATQIMAGQDATGTAVPAGRSGSVAVSSTGAKTMTANGLTPSTSGYFAHLTQKGGAGNQSTVISSASFSTPAQTLGSELLTNGTYASAGPPPTLGSGVTITSGHAQGTNVTTIAQWTGVLTPGNLYRVVTDYNCTSGSGLRVNNSTTNGAAIKSTATITVDGATHTVTFTDFVASGTDLSIEADAALYTGWIDNTSCKQVI